MLDLVGKIATYEKPVGKYILERVETYFASQCYRSLQNRRNRLRDSLDMKFHQPRSGTRTNSEWKSKISIPLVREAYLARRAVTLAAFAKEPLISVVPTGATTIDSARALQDTMQSNFRSTLFRERCLRPLILSASRYGNAVSISYYRADQTQSMKTLPKMVGGLRLGYERAAVPRFRKGIYSQPINILNYFQNPLVVDYEDSDYQGYIERWRLADFIDEVKADQDRPEDERVYLEANCRKAIEEARKGGVVRDSNYKSDGGDADTHAVGLEVTHYYGRLNVPGNEDDQTEYYCEMVGSNLVRIEENPNDDDVRPLTIYGMDQREEYWWSNVDSESVIPHENYLNLLFGMAADNGLRALQNYIFFDKRSGLDIADLNNRAKNGGFVGFDGKPGQTARDLFYRYEFPEANLQNVQYMAQEMKEAASRVKAKQDFGRSPVQGGPRNDTATAAIYMSEQGDIQENFVLNEFAVGIKRLGRVTATMLQQRLGDKFRIRPTAESDPMELEKWQILGDYGYNVESSFTRNQQIRAMNLLNAITAMINFRGSGDPTWGRVNMEQVVKQWLREIDLGVDIEQLLPPAPEQSAGVPGAGGPVVPGGIPGAPAVAPAPMAATPQAAAPQPGPPAARMAA